ncbi:MAG: DUF1643 domain-containing protein [Nevskiaceae bacterium]|nr:MAG: DUF1643 domain-containing protein [Nevskiaceae bacterium]
MDRTTIFSPDRLYRYTLWREWLGGEGYCMFIGLNPSTADEVQDDPTIRRCIGFAKSWGYGALCMTNAFAYRATDPKVMKAQAEPVGPDNDSHLQRVAAEAGVIVAAWGVHGSHRNRCFEIPRLIPNLHCLARTQLGDPKHPLYLRADLRPVPFNWERPAP